MGSKIHVEKESVITMEYKVSHIVLLNAFMTFLGNAENETLTAITLAEDSRLQVDFLRVNGATTRKVTRRYALVDFWEQDVTNVP